MGNFASKEGQVPAGEPHLDLFHSLPNSPLPTKLQGTPLPLAPAPKKLGGSRGSYKERSPPVRSPSLTATLKHGALLNQTGSDVDAVLCPPPSHASTPLPESEHVTKDGGQKRSSAVGDRKGDGCGDRQGDGCGDRKGDGCGDGQGDASALRRLLLECRTSLDLGPEDDDDEGGTQGAVDLLRCILVERGELVKEVQSLKETLETERAEWLQFQSDLQVAVSVADRLHLEAQEELEQLQGAQEEKDRQLAAAQEKQAEAERELEAARAELEDARQKVSALTAELSELRGGTQTRTGQAAGGGSATVTDGNQRKGASGSGAESRLGEGPVAERPQVEGKAGLQNVAPEEKNRGEGGKSPPGTRAPEQSRGLSRLPLLSPSTSAVNGISQAATTTTAGSPSKIWSPTRGKRADPALEGQESGSAGKQEEGEPVYKHSATPTEGPHKGSKTQDGFSLLLRRHGGSKRNSLLRWCQSRTQGYKNIDITNFSSSWSDGLAFCAVFHSYLPSVIPYSGLCPADRRENLSLAFRTGESVGIAASLTVEEVLRRGGPDWQRVLGYVESIYRHFEM